MKKILNMIKRNIFICDLIFIGVNILVNFILYLINIRFRLWVILLIILFSAIGFISGIIQLLYIFLKNKKEVVFLSLLVMIPILGLIFTFMPFIKIAIVFSYKPEHTTILDDKKYVAVVRSFTHVDVDYYDYYGFLLMGTKIKVHGYFGKGGYDPFITSNIADKVEYTYYDEEGKVKYTRTEILNKDKVEKNDDINSDNSNHFNENDNYLLPENEEVLYEKKIDQTILRFSKVGNTLGQNILTHVVRSKDNGKNFYVVSDDAIQVSNEAKFAFLDENLGFVVNTGKIYLDNHNTGLYVTNDSGKTFTSAIFNYVNENVDYISIEEIPYYENDILKIKCSVYQINSSKDGYEDKELIFKSDDNGLTWNIENN